MEIKNVFVVGSGLMDPDAAVICTGADNWSFGDRLVTARSHSVEQFSDAANAGVLSREGGFAKIHGTGTASCQAPGDAWRTR